MEFHPLSPIRWISDDAEASLLDQTLLPLEEKWVPIRSAGEMAQAIRRLAVRGAPAIGIAAAYGVVLAARDSIAAAHQAIPLLAATRPTAVNLFIALERMKRRLEGLSKDAMFEGLLSEAHAINAEDLEAGRRLGMHGLSLLPEPASVLTHCHAGGVATSGYGTALAPLFMARRAGRDIHVYVDETRPLLQGSRITAWELGRAGIDATLITDSMAAHVMQQGRVDAVIVGADRIAANGDVANKIGTYGLAVLAAAHQIPFYVAAPLTTLDFATPAGEGIVIEERASEEVTHAFGRQTAPDGCRVYNPAFDITPARLITALITEEGVIRRPCTEALQQHGVRPHQQRSGFVHSLDS